MPLFYHYTDADGAMNIIRTGKIMVSGMSMASDDSAFGNGVYLTKLEPTSYTKIEIAKNNWMNSSEQFIKKTEYCFVVEIPESEVKDTKAKDRNIFLFGFKNDLRLKMYPWWLKNYDSGLILASYKYQVMSFGPASELFDSKMGVYTMTEETINGRPSYEHKGVHFYMESKGNWIVGPDAGGDRGWLLQRSKFSLGPDPNLLWEYWDDKKKWHKNDATLKAYAWQK